MTVPAIYNIELSISRVVYLPNLQRGATPSIPLGVMAELSAGGYRAIGLIARTLLLDSEQETVGRLIRPRLANPFEYLKGEFEWAADVPGRGGRALASLAQRHSDSLFFAPPTLQTWKKALADPALPEYLLSTMCEHRDREFFVMVAEAPTYLGNHPDIRTEAKLAA